MKAGTYVSAVLFLRKLKRVKGIAYIFFKPSPGKLITSEFLLFCLALR